MDAFEVLQLGVFEISLAPSRLIEQTLFVIKTYGEHLIQFADFPIRVQVPADAILVGAKGLSKPDDLHELSTAVEANNYGGIMVWYASVKNGLKYATSYDASKDKAAQEAYIKIRESFGI